MFFHVTVHVSLTDAEEADYCRTVFKEIPNVNVFTCDTKIKSLSVQS